MSESEYDVRLSFIIPVFNEENMIADTIASIRGFVESVYSYEVIVVDNGSEDNTVRTAKDRGAMVIEKPDVSIGSLRNEGAKKARGEIIVFLDADVSLTRDWPRGMKKALDTFEKSPLTITGSKGNTTDDPPWVEKFWYGEECRRRVVNYLGGGHLIMSKKFFYEIGGFDPALETGEDYDICKRARAHGARVINDPGLPVVNRAYPKTLKIFFDKVRWHGRGDYVSLGVMMSSKPAILSLAQLAIFLCCIAAAVATKNLSYMFIYLVFMVALCLGASLYRVGGVKVSAIPTIILYAAYFMARATAFFDVVWDRWKKR